jgi:predicted permease
MGSRLRSYWRRLVNRDSFERHMSDEMRFHLESRAGDLVARGMSAGEARRRARLEFGNPAVWAEHCRDARGRRAIDELRQDVRFAWRGIVRRRLTAAIVVLTLTFGIGISSGVFTMLSAAALRPQVTDDPGSFVRLYTAVTTDPRQPAPLGPSTLEQYFALRQRLTSVRAIAASRDFGASIGGGASERAVLASCNLFETYGVRRAILGRLLVEADCTRSEPVVVLAEDIWRRRFDADAAIVGRTVAVAGLPMTVIGVAPSASAPDGGAAWMPYTLRATFRIGSRKPENGQDRWLNISGRLAPGITVARAQTEADVAAPVLATDQPSQRATLRVTDGALIHDPNVRGNVIGGMALTMAALSALVLIVCANVTTLLLSQGAARREEIAIRLAMGAGRARLVRMLLTESLVLAGCAGVLGYLVARAVPGLLLRWFTDRPPTFPMTPDWRVFVYLFVSAALAGIAAGLGPALDSLRTDIVTAIKGQRSLVGPRSASRAPDVLVVAQVALGFILLTGASLFLITHYETVTRDPGYASHQVLMPRVSYSQTAPATARPGSAVLREALQSVSGARAVAFAATAPGFAGDGADVAAHGVTIQADVNDVSPGFFQTVDIAMLRGRALGTADGPCRGGGCAVVVSNALASRLFPGTDALGEEMNAGGETLHIVGIAADTSVAARNQADRPALYRPWTDDGRPYQALVRVDGDVRAAAVEAARELRDRFPGAIVDVHTLRWPLEVWLAEVGGIEDLVVALGLAAALLAALGVFGVVSFTVSRREREFGIRIALGATSAQIYATVLRTASRPVAAGLAAGATAAMLAAAAFAGILARLQFTIAAFDPRLYVLAAVPLTVAAVLAMILPARRATAVDPMRALKYE